MKCLYKLGRARVSNFGLGKGRDQTLCAYLFCPGEVCEDRDRRGSEPRQRRVRSRHHPQVKFKLGFIIWAVITFAFWF